MPENSNSLTILNSLLETLGDAPEGREKIVAAIDIAAELLEHFGEPAISKSEETVDEVLTLPRQNVYDSWFLDHPTFENQPACYEIPVKENAIIQPKLYCLKKRSRLVISGAVAFTPNWEDEDYTRNDDHNIGIDFYLSPEQDSVIVALSDRGNVRVVELERRITNTQFEIFKQWEGLSKEKNRAKLHAKLWKSFELKSVNKLFYLEVAKYFDQLVEHVVGNGKSEEDAKLFSSRLIGRILFCWFLRKKEIISEKYEYFEVGDLNSTEYYREKLEPLFFGTLNKPIDERAVKTRNVNNLFGKDDETPYLNGGLFEAHSNDWYKDESLTFPANYFRDIYMHFNQFNFTTDESSAEYEQVAIDPEMLGQIFESLLATQIDETGKQARKAKGSFYTPRVIVSYMCTESVRQYLFSKLGHSAESKGQIELLLDRSDKDWATNNDNWRRDIKQKREILEALDVLKSIDPACGSGAFPMGMVQLLVKIYERLETRFDVEKTKLSILENNIYGVDIEPMAVEISRLRAWLTVVVESKNKAALHPLPNLDFKFVCANSLVPLQNPTQGDLLADQALHVKLAEIVRKYFKAKSYSRKKSLRQEYENIVASETLGGDNHRTLQLKSFNPFSSRSNSLFFDKEHMFAIEEGFDIVIGNPPYGGSLKEVEKNLHRNFFASAGKKGRGLKGSINTFSLFMDLGLFHLIGQNGILSYIVPLSFTASEQMQKLHQMMFSSCEEISILSFSNRPRKIFDNADQRVSIVVASKNGKMSKRIMTTKVMKRYENPSVSMLMNNLSFVNSQPYSEPGRIPKIGNPIEIGILDKLKSAPTLREYVSDEQGQDNAVYYRAAGGRYYNLIFNYRTGSSAEKYFTFTGLDRDFICAVLTSNLFFWFYHINSDNLNIKRDEILMCPIPKNISDLEQSQIAEIYRRYLVDLENNGITKKAEYNNISEFKEYKARLSKNIIDEIDRKLLKFYRLNSEETEFIINYDLEFRTDSE